MKRELTERENEIIRHSKENNGKILGKDNKSFGYDILTSQYYYINKNKAKNHLDFIPNSKSFLKIIEEQFLSEKEVRVDDYFFSIFTQNLKGRRVVFNPHRSEIFEDFGGDNFYNTFSTDSSKLGIRDFQNKKIKEGKLKRKKGIAFLDKTPFIKILLKNITNNSDENLEYFLNWLSACVNTRDKIMTAIAIIGAEEGTGKGVFEKILDLIYGEMKITISNRQLESRFNSCFNEKLFVVLNEIKTDLKDSSKIAEELKMLITDSELQIERKGIDSIVTTNYLNFLLYSNEFLPIKISAADRRWTVIDTSAVKLDLIAEKLGYSIQEFVEKVMEEANQFIYNLFLMDFDLRRAKRPLQTDTKNNIVENTSSKLEIVCKKIIKKDFDWIKDRLEEVKNSDNFSAQDIDDNLFASIESDFFKNRINNNILFTIYKYLIDSTELSTNRISHKLQPFFGKSFASNGNRYRILDKNKVNLDEISENFLDKKVEDLSKIDFDALKSLEKREDSIEEKEVSYADFLSLCKKISIETEDLFFIKEKKDFGILYYFIELDNEKYFIEVLKEEILSEEDKENLKGINSFAIPF